MNKTEVVDTQGVRLMHPGSDVATWNLFLGSRDGARFAAQPSFTVRGMRHLYILRFSTDELTKIQAFGSSNVILQPLAAYE